MLAFGFSNIPVLVIGEIIQFLNIIVNFFVAYKEEGDDKFEQNFSKISLKYLNGPFLTDTLILIPFGLIGHINTSYKNWKILWSIKVIRIKSMITILDLNKIKPLIRKFREN